MATSTFDKRIIIDEPAADVLIELLKKPAPPRPEPSGIRWATEEDDRKCLQSILARSAEQSSKKK